MKTDYNKLFHLAESLLLDNFNYCLPLSSPKSFKLLKDIYSEDTIYQWANKPTIHWIPDALKDLNKLSKHPQLIKELKELPKKAKNFRDFHNDCSYIFSFLDIPDFNLDQKEYVLELDNKNIDDYTIVVPKTKHELIAIGNKFRFCIGTEPFYADSIKQGSHSFIALFKGKKPISGLFFNKNRIVSSYDYANKTTHFTIREKVRNLLFKSEEIIMNPNSSFTNEIRYSPEEEVLTIVTKKNMLRYKGVPQDVVSEFENSSSHGRFYSQYIKGNYQYLGKS